MWYNGMWVPDVIAADVFPGSSRPTLVRQTTETTPAKSTDNTTRTILLLGVLTSMAGLALEIYKYRREKT